TLFGYPIPIIFALLLNELRQRRFKRVVQTVTYMPHFISMVVICGMIFSFTRTTGPLAQIVSQISGRPVENLLARADLFRPIYIVSSVWQGFGWASIIYFAALSGVDPTLYEAASIDGASRLRQVFAVTIPSIMPTIIIMYILRIGQIMSVGFEKIILLYSPATYETADVISSYVYRQGIVDLKFSYSTAVGVFNSIINLAAIIIANYLSGRISETTLW
ncbi:MAG: sugar ABC transporter permease, partial [Clostridiales bacterium]|nr:sugar ABC transporter permease [Clostridiales bacterium]